MGCANSKLYGSKSNYAASEVSYGQRTVQSNYTLGEISEKPKGVSVYWLKHGFLQEVVDFGLDENATIYTIENLDSTENGVIRKKGENMKCPTDGRLGASYLDCLEGDENVGPANIMLSYGWGYTIGEIVDTLSEHCDTHYLDPKCTYVWICCLCNNQHRVAEQRRDGIVVPFDEFRHIFHERMITIGRVMAIMSPWNEPLYLTRVWCIFELYTANAIGCELIITTPPKERKKLEDALIDYKTMDVFFDALIWTKIENAEASEPNDKHRIFTMVKEGPGFIGLNNEMNMLLRERVGNAILDGLENYESQVSDASTDLDFADSCNHVGLALHEHFSAHDTAISLMKKALTIYERVEGTDSPNTSSVHGNIGLVLHKSGDLNGALTEYTKGLAIDEKILKKDDPDLATSYVNIGSLMTTRGDFDDALKTFRKALDIQEKTLGKNHQHTGTTYIFMGRALQEKGELEKALIEYRKGLEVREKGLGTENPLTALAYSNIAGVLLEKGDYENALIEYRKALEIHEKVLKKDHPDTATIHNNIGSVLEAMGDEDAALIEYRNALDMREIYLGKEHVDTALSLNNIASVLRTKKDYDNALSHYLQSFATLDSILGDGHSHTEMVRENLCLLQEEMADINLSKKRE